MKSGTKTTKRCSDKRAVWAWAFYDWGNSAFATTVMAGFFPVFFKEFWSQGVAAESSTYSLGLANSGSSFLIAVTAPLLGALADHGFGKKIFLYLFTSLGVLTTAGLFYVPMGEWQVASILYATGSLAFAGALTFYDALLTDVALPRDFDRVSSFGYSLGYLGGGLLFLLNILMYTKYNMFGLRSATEGVRWSFLSVALWWAFFTLPLAFWVHEGNKNQKRHSLFEILQTSLTSLRSTFFKILGKKKLLHFIFAYVFYIDGVNTIIKMAVDYGLSIGLNTADLIGALLMVQFLSFPAALAFGRISERFSAQRCIEFCLVVYAFVTIGATQMKTGWHFYTLAIAISLVQGGIQALSRSLFASLIPQDESAEYFGFFNLVGKFSAIVGPLLVGWASLYFHQPRWSILVLLLLFATGGFFLHRLKRTTVSLLVLFSLGLSFKSEAAIYPAETNWKQIQTLHFTIIFSDRNIALGRVYAAAAEKAYQTLLVDFKEGWDSPIPVVLADFQDQANGMATFLPYPFITLYPVLPTAGDSLDHYENWAYELILHEVAHLFTFYPRHGFYRPLSWIFGNLVTPNAFTPRWYLEGLAVEMESRHTTHGRLRSPQVDAQLRAFTNDGRWSLFSLDRINESDLPWYPYGSHPYVFGSLLWHDIREKTDATTIFNLNQRFSRRLPFLLNQPLKDEINKDWSEEWGLLKDRLKRAAQTSLDEIEGQGVDPLTRVDGSSTNQSLPALNSDRSKLVYIGTSPHEDADVYLKDRSQQKHASFTTLRSEKLFSVSGTSRLSWFPDGDKLLFDQIAKVEAGYFKFRDLYIYDFATRKTERLTHKARAAEPSVSPNGEAVIYIQQGEGRSSLVLMNLKSKTQTILFSGPINVRLSWPTFLSDQKIVFSGRDSKGVERLRQIDLKTRKVTLFSSTAVDTSRPEVFDSEVTAVALVEGRYNAIQLKSDGLSRPEVMSNSLTNVSHALKDPLSHELLSVRLSGEGRQLYASPLHEFRLKPLRSGSIVQFKDASQGPYQAPPVNAKIEDYSAWPHLWPQYWIPFVYPLDNGVIFQGMMNSSDPVYRHNYSLLGSYDSLTSQASYGVSYTNSTWHLADTTLAAAVTNELLGAGSDHIQNRSFILDESFPMPLISWSWVGDLNLINVHTEVPSASGSTAVDRLGVGARIRYDKSRGAETSRLRDNDRYGHIDHVTYVPAAENLSYDRESFSFGGNTKWILPTRHRLAAHIKGSYAPRLPISQVIYFGDRTIGGNYLVTLINSNYLLRGYPSGALAGRTLLNSSFEYRFPLLDVFRGSGTFPFFFKNFEGRLFVDAALVDGAYFDPRVNSYFRARTGDVFTGTGFELSLNNSAGYHLPVSITLGLYYGFKEKAGGGVTTFLGLGYSGHGGVDGNSTRLRPNSLAR